MCAGSRGEAGLQLWEPLREGQGQAQLWDLGPWPQFPCFKAQDFVPGSGSTTVWAEAREDPHHSLCGGVWWPGSDHPLRGFSSKGHMQAWGLPCIQGQQEIQTAGISSPWKR